MSRPKPKWAPNKICTDCKELKLLVEFSPSKHGPLGRQSKCRVCCAKDQKAKYKYRKVEANRRSTQWAKDNKERFNKLARDNYRKRKGAGSNAFAAKQAVQRAVLAGKLERKPCQICFKLKSQAHHWSYLKEYWLDVIWLCTEHHGWIHREMRKCKQQGETNE